MAQPLLLMLVTLLAFGVATSIQAQEADVPPDVVWDGTYRRARVPILMYHYVSVPPEDADEYRIDLSISPELFRAHVEYLFYEGFTPITLYQLDEALLTGHPLPPKPVVLTFDDGYLDHYTHVFPALQQYNFPGTFFVITGMADEANPNHLNWDQISEMSAAGMNIESHTKTHPDLRNRDHNFLVYELLGSFESLRAHTGRPSLMFCYPAGQYDAAVLNVLRTMPVRRAVTTRQGTLHTSDNRLEMARVRIGANTTVPVLAELLEGA